MAKGLSWKQQIPRLILDERKDDKRFWIEFDNDTEGPRQIERKFHDYVRTLMPVVETSPVLWVTTNEQRRNYLERNWEAFSRQFYRNKPIPKMEFFVEGEETSYLMNST